MNDPLKREFYIEVCRLEHWSVRQLQERIDSMLFERTAISRKPEDTIHHDLEQLRQDQQVSPDLLLKDPYILDFLDLRDRYLEKDLEDAILRDIEKFLLELGAGFTFVARQKRIQIDNDDFYIDLLFYNRKLKRLVAIDLKLGNFRHEYKSQMELYLRWLAKYDQENNELPPLGIILCAGKKQEQIELLELDKSGIHVAEYLTVLPPKELFQAKLQEAIAAARRRLPASELD
jgi:predicted nuclease of restriction endonuclease-like (RecB) superfamily